MGEAAGDAYRAVCLALIEGDLLCAKAAYQKVCVLKERNGYTVGPDIPADHVETNGVDFRCLLETLQDKLWERMLAMGRGEGPRL